MKITTLKTLATALVCTLAAATAEAQTAPKMEMTTDIPPGIVSPDKVETRLGTLNFIDGFPDDASVAKLFDNLDFQRAVQAYLFALPPVSMASLRGAKQARLPARGTPEDIYGNPVLSPEERAARCRRHPRPEAERFGDLARGVGEDSRAEFLAHPNKRVAIQGLTVPVDKPALFSQVE